MSNGAIPNRAPPPASVRGPHARRVRVRHPRYVPQRHPGMPSHPRFVLVPGDRDLRDVRPGARRVHGAAHQLERTGALLPMTTAKGAWVRTLRRALVRSRGGACEWPFAQGCGRTRDLEFHHAIRNGLNGQGRGSYERTTDTLLQPGHYVLLCAYHHTLAEAFVHENRLLEALREAGTYPPGGIA